jgi:L-ascorbate metabolism protein UlaG (beta-lactamase superfamily)
MSARLRYVGHATVLLELDGVRLLTDPLLRRRVAHLWRTTRVDVEPLHDLNAVLVSHAHHDHLDLPSLERLGRELPVIVPRGLAPLLRKHRFGHVVEVAAGEEIAIGGLTLRATRADHSGARTFSGGVTAGAVGYAILGSRRIYFAGDTELFDEMNGLVDGLDVALIPIWGWGPSLGRGKHLDPKGAAEAIRRLRPRIAVPIHWGTYRPIHLGVFDEPAFLRWPAEVFERATADAAPEVEVRVLKPGEETEL